jgi:hypothetical protein
MATNAAIIAANEKLFAAGMAGKIDRGGAAADFEQKLDPSIVFATPGTPARPSELPAKEIVDEATGKVRATRKGTVVGGAAAVGGYDSRDGCAFVLLPTRATNYFYAAKIR